MIERTFPSGLTVDEELMLLRVLTGHPLELESSSENSHRVTIQEALGVPFGEEAVSFYELLEIAEQEKSSLLLIVNDAERATRPTHLMLSEVLPLLFERKIPLTLAVATGTHKDPTEADLEKIFGEWLDVLRSRNIDIITNQRGGEEVLTSVPDQLQEDGVARTHRGTRVRAHRRLFTPNQIVVALNSVEPHPRAGFTGGTKSFWPGMGTAPDILRNHQMVLLDGAEDVRWNAHTGKVDPVEGTVSKVGPLSVAQNPERQDMTEVVQRIDHYRQQELGLLPFHSLNVVMDVQGDNVVSARWGTPQAVSDSLNGVAAEVYSYKAKEADTIILEVPDPQGETLEQSLKSFAFICNIIPPEGIVILVASFSKGAGNPHFVQNFEGRTVEDLERMLSESRADFTQAPTGVHTVPSVVRVLEKTDRIMAVPRRRLETDVETELGNYPILSFKSSIAEILQGRDLSRTQLITNSTMMVPQLHRHLDAK